MIDGVREESYGSMYLSNIILPRPPPYKRRKLASAISSLPSPRRSRKPLCESKVSECGAIVMEKDASPPSDPNSTTTTLSTSPPPTSILEPRSPPSIHSDDEQRKQQQFSTKFTALYRSIFSPNSPPSNTSTSTSSPPRSSALSAYIVQQNASSDSSTTSDADRRLEQACLAVEYDNLRGRYSISRAHLQNLTNEINTLRKENASLKLEKTELEDLLKLSSQASLHDSFRRLNLIGSGYEFGGDEMSSYGPASVVEQTCFEKTEPERVWLPKSISVRSSSYHKANQSAAHISGSSRMASQLQAAAELEAGKQRMYLPGVKKELEVYSQGMLKTELCNKWQETGACPYGDNCQFAHGIAELRPVIRHPRYKTEVCRMVLAGDTCPYGHRCHFRHSLTDQEMMFAGAPPR